MNLKYFYVDHLMFEGLVTVFKTFLSSSTTVSAVVGAWCQIFGQDSFTLNVNNCIVIVEIGLEIFK